MKQLMRKPIQHHLYFLSVLIFFVSVSNAMAVDKVVVIPLSSSKMGPSVKRTISIPAHALMFTAADATVITADEVGLLWKADFRDATSLTIKAPNDYTGGNVDFYIFFKTTTATPGKVDFFLRPTSLNSGDGIVDPSSLNSTEPVDVSGVILFGTVYQQSFVIPEGRMTGDWWTTSIQRQGTGATYPDDVVVLGVAFEYQAVQ